MEEPPPDAATATAPPADEAATIPPAVVDDVAETPVVAAEDAPARAVVDPDELGPSRPSTVDDDDEDVMDDLSAVLDVIDEVEEVALVADDSDAETRLTAHTVKSHVEVTVTWAPPKGTAPGTYRLVHDGAYLHKPWPWSHGEVVQYRGASDPFTLTAAAAKAAAA